MLTSSLGAGYAIVPEPFYQAPISRSTQASLPAHAGTFVQRSPLNVVREAEAGSTFPMDLSKFQFDPDGKLVPARPYAYDQFSGSDPMVIAAQPVRRGVKPAFISMLLGAGAGGALVKQHRIGGAIGGAVVGGILGLIFG